MTRLTKGTLMLFLRHPILELRVPISPYELPNCILITRHVFERSKYFVWYKTLNLQQICFSIFFLIPPTKKVGNMGLS